MKMIYVLPLAVAATMAISGCSKKKAETAMPASEPAMQPAPAMSAHSAAMPAAPMSSSGSMSNGADSMSEPAPSGSSN